MLKIILGMLFMVALKTMQIIIRTIKAMVLVITSFFVSIAVIFMDARR